MCKFCYYINVFSVSPIIASKTLDILPTCKKCVPQNTIDKQISGLKPTKRNMLIETHYVTQMLKKKKK